VADRGDICCREIAATSVIDIQWYFRTFRQSVVIHIAADEVATIFADVVFRQVKAYKDKWKLNKTVVAFDFRTIYSRLVWPEVLAQNRYQVLITMLLATKLI
jgi:hypothetical protein